MADFGNIVVTVNQNPATNVTIGTVGVGVNQQASQQVQNIQYVSNSIDSYARELANSANTLAQTAYSLASSGGGGGVSASGYLANSIIFVNTTGYLSNTSRLQFISSNNTLITSNVKSTTGFIFPDGTIQTTAGGAGISPGIVTPGTYGNTSYVPVITVDTYGRVTNVTNTYISGAGVTEPSLGVSGTYGNTSYIPVVTVAANGRIIAVTNTAISTTLAQAAFDKANIDFTNITTTAGTYGNTSYVPVITIAANGRITAVTNTVISNTLAQAAFDKANTDVTNITTTAGTYGNTTFVPSITIAANGRVTNITNTVISFPVEPSLGVSGTYGNTSYVPVITVSSNGRIIAITNTVISNTLAQAAFDKANTDVTNISVTPGTYGNSTFIPSITIAANGRIIAVTNTSTLIQSAYDQAVAANALAQTKLSSSGGTISGSLTVQKDLTVQGNVSFIGNVTSIQVTGNTGQFFGYASNGFNALYAGIPTGYFLEPQISFQISSNYDGYSGLNMQNINTGANASSDLFITSDNGTVTDGFLDLGFASSTYNYTGYSLIGKNDGYLFATGNTTTGGGNMIVGTGLNNDVIFSVGGLNTSNEIARFKYNTGLILKKFPVTFADGTTQNTAAISAAISQTIYNQANTANTLAQAGFNQANTANNLAQAAYNQANSANTLAQAGFNQANTANNLAQSAYNQANNDVTSISITSGTYGNSTYVPVITVAANGRIIAVTNTAITVSGGGGGGVSASGYLANSIIFANTTGYLSNTSGLQFISSNNTLISYNVKATGTGFIFPDGTVQTTASSGGASEPSLGVSGTYGNTSYVPVVTVAANGRVTNVVNTAISTTLAQAAFDKANTANTLAQAAFNKGNYLTINVDNFTATGSSSTFTLSVVPPSSNNVIVNLNGITQLKSSYTIVGSSVILSETPVNGTLIDVITFLNGSNDVIGQSAYIQANTATIIAQAAFNQANTAIGGGYSWFMSR